MQSTRNMTLLEFNLLRCRCRGRSSDLWRVSIGPVRGRWSTSTPGSVRQKIRSSLLGRKRRKSSFFDQSRGRFNHILAEQVLMNQLQELLLVELNARLSDNISFVNLGQRDLKLVHVRLGPTRDFLE